MNYQELIDKVLKNKETRNDIFIIIVDVTINKLC